MPRKNNPADALAEMSRDLRAHASQALDSGDAVSAIRSAVSADALECAALSRYAFGAPAAKGTTLEDLAEELDREEKLCRFRSR